MLSKTLPAFFVLSTVEPEASAVVYFVIMGILFIILVLLAYILYSSIKSPTKVKSWLGDIKDGYNAAGMPVWWDQFSKTYYAMFIRIVGLTCITITRVIMPNYSSIDLFIHKYSSIYFFIFGMSIIGYSYLLVYSICAIQSVIKYLITGKYKKFNSPMIIEATTRRVFGAVAKVGSVLTGATIAAASGLQSVDYIQSEVFDASKDQLITSQVRKGVDYIKKQTGYGYKSSMAIATQDKVSNLADFKQAAKAVKQATDLKDVKK